MDLHEEGVRLTKDALEIYERLSDTVGEVQCLAELTRSLCEGRQFGAAEVASRAIGLVPRKGNQSPVHTSHRVPGYIYHSKGGVGKAAHRHEVALTIAPSFG